MKSSRKGTLGRWFGKAVKPIDAVKHRVQKTLGYDSAFAGWDNDSPMSEYPKLRALKHVFKKHAPQTPLMIVAPMLWADLVVDIAKIISPNQSNALLPRYQNSTIDDDLAKFKPNEKLKKRLKASTSLETSRSFTRSFFKVMGMYWMKAGPKEVAIATSLLAMTLYASKESVDVLAEFSNWGRDFYNFYAGAGGVSNEFKQGIFESLKVLHGLDAYETQTLDLLQNIVEYQDSLDWSLLNVEQALSGVRISEDLAQQIASDITTQFGDLSLDRFVEGNQILKVTDILSNLKIPNGDGFIPLTPQEITSVQNALFNGVDVSTAFGDIAVTADIVESVEDEIRVRFGNVSLEQFSDANGIATQLQRILTDAGLGLRQSLEIKKAIFTSAEIKSTIPDIIEKVQAEFGSFNFTDITTQDRAEDAEKVMNDLDYLMANSILSSSGVEQNTGHILGRNPGEFGSLLGRYLLYALPALYTAEHMALRWETWMKGKVSNEWLKYKTAYHLKFSYTNVDNVDQRIQENLEEITDFAVSTTTDGMQNAIKLAVFLPMLGAMGSFNPSFLGGPDIEISNFLSWSALGYAALGTGALYAAAKSLPKLKRAFQKARGNQRAALMSVNMQPEQIALTEGEEQEKRILRDKHEPVVRVRQKLINQSVKITGVSATIGNAGYYLPYLLAMPQYFAGIIDFGQANQAMGLFRRVEDSFSFIKDAIVPFSDFKAAIDRQAQLIDGQELVRYEELERRYYMGLEDNAEAASAAVPQGPEGGLA